LLVQPGELYLSLKDVTQSADLLGAVARLPQDHLPGRLTQDTVKLEPKSDDVPLDYLYWLLRTPQYRAYCRSHATGTTNLGLSRDDFLAFPALEPSSEQLLLVEMLGAMEDKIELNRRMNETLERIARALFKSWFVDFDPVRAKAEGRDLGFPGQIADLFPDSFTDSELGEIPRGWLVQRLPEIADVFSGGTPSKSVADFWNGSLPWISPKAMTSIHVDRSEENVTPAAIGSGARLVKKGSVLVMVRGMGLHQGVRISQARCDVTFNQDVKALVPKWGDGTYLLFALLDASPYLFSKVQSSGHGTGVLPTDVLEDLPFAMPTTPTCDKLSEPLANLNSMIASNIGQSDTLVALRDTLLPKLISGEIRVKDAVRKVEAVV
jgi:type I restriction enzyme S subunit